MPLRSVLSRFRRSLPVTLILLLSALPLLAANPCRDCHEEVVTALSKGAHADARFCTACHGDATKHLQSNDANDIVRGADIAKWTPEKRAAACASCHAAEFPGWRTAAHTSEGLCWSCHLSQVRHGGKSGDVEKVSSRPSFELCASCHVDVAAQFRMHYRHPVENGQVACTSCHDVHGRAANQQQIVADSTCLTCHEEQSGPFLFAHGAMDNGCSTCHAPHGSAHRAQLRSAGNGACLSCHLQSNFPTVGAASHDFRLSGGGRCWDCHSEVHGSNTTPDLNPRGRR